MKTIITISVISATLLFAQTLKAEENYWETITRLKKNPIPETDTTYKSYIESLSAEQLIKAAIQCSIEGEINVKEEYWDIAIGALGFFYEYYPLKSNNMYDIKVLLNEISNKQNPLFWRYSLIHFLGTSWQDKLLLQQKIESASLIHQILLDNTEPIYIRIKAANNSTKLLIVAHKENILDDPEVERFVEQGKNYSDAIKNIQKGSITLIEDTLDRNNIIELILKESIHKQIEFLLNTDMPNYLSRHIIGNLIKLREFDKTDEIRQAMNDALQNFRKYDDQLWENIARANISYFQNDNVAYIVDQMLVDVKDEHEKKYDLPNLKNSISEGKIERKPYNIGISLIKLPEPKSVEPVDVNEIIDWLEQIRLEDETINNIMDANQWQEFIDAIKQN